MRSGNRGRRGFALALVLIAAAGIFALAIATAVTSRTAQLEARLLRQRVEGERRARSAAVMVLKGITTLPDSANSLDALASSSSTSSSSGRAGASTPPPGVPGAADATTDSGKSPDLPQILKELLGVKEADDINKGATNAAAAAGGALVQGGGLTGTVSRRTLSAITVLEKFGIPAVPIDVKVEGAWYRVSLSDAGGLLNLNQVEPEQFHRYLMLKGVEPVRAKAIAAQLVDWRDKDSFTHEMGAEQDLYRLRGISCRNDDLKAPEELLYLPAMTREIYESIRNDVCVAGDGRIGVPWAPAEVLLSFPGVTSATVEPLLRARASGIVPKEAADAVIAQADASVRKLLRVKPMGVLKVIVEPIAAEKDAAIDPGVKFDGLAVISDQGLQDVGIRPM